MPRPILVYAALTLAVQACLGEEVVSFRLELVDAQGRPVDEVRLEDRFQLRAWVEDRRVEPRGVFSSYLDVDFDGGLVEPVAGSLVFGERYGLAGSGHALLPFQLDEIGSLARSLEPIGGGEFLAWRVEFRAAGIGVVHFAAQPADILPRHETTLFLVNDAVPPEKTIFGSATVRIIPEPGNSLAAAWAALALLLSRRPIRQLV